MKRQLIRLLINVVVLVMLCLKVYGQSFEFMPGTQGVFMDAQWLNTFDANKKWSLFSRSRAKVDYEDNTDLFTGAYLNYTTPSGFGGTVLGRISSMGAGGDAGIHFFKVKGAFLVYALASIDLSTALSYSWFSILRYTPELNPFWRIYTSLELFSNFNEGGHVASVQRIRAGLDHKGYQFGLALNLSGLGLDYSTTSSNPGIFLRRQF